MFFVVRHFCGGHSSEQVRFCMYSVVINFRFSFGGNPNILDSAKGVESSRSISVAQFFHGVHHFVFFPSIMMSSTKMHTNNCVTTFPSWYFSQCWCEKCFFAFSFQRQSFQQVTVLVSMKENPPILQSSPVGFGLRPGGSLIYTCGHSILWQSQSSWCASDMCPCV